MRATQSPRVLVLLFGLAASLATGPLLEARQTTQQTQTQTQQTTQGRGQGRGQTQQGQGQGGRQGGQTGTGQAGQGRGGTRDTPAQGQQQATGTGAISGSVVAADNGRPVRRARVSLGGGDVRVTKSATTDDQGKFSFTQLPAGRYTLNASKTGYVNATYGQKKPGRPGTPIQLADNQQLDSLKVPLPKGGVITGTVLDDTGDASPGTQVTAWRAEMRTGEKRYVQAGSDQTDDRGMYRIYGLMPGDYLVRATPRNTLNDLRQIAQDMVQSLATADGRGGAGGLGGGRGGAGGIGGALGNLLGGRGGGPGGGGPGGNIVNALLGNDPNAEDSGTGYAPVYYPGTPTSSNATSVTLDVSQERQGIDFQLQLMQTAKVSGMVTSPEGDMGGISLTLINETERAIGGGVNTARVQQDGTFAFTNVAPGQYVLQARQVARRGGRGGGRGGFGGFGGGAPGQAQGAGQAGQAGQTQQAEAPETYWGEATVVVDGRPVTGLSLTLQAGMHVSGRLAFEGGQAPTDLTRVRVALQPSTTDNNPLDFSQNAPAQVDASGSFTITGVPPGQYSVRVQGGVQGYSLKSAVTGGRDALDFPLEIHPNENVADLTVTMSNKSQQLSGTLTDGSNMPTADYTVIVFSADTRYWTPQSRRITTARPGTDGKYVMRNLPPGDYLLAAVTDVEPGDWFDPKFLEQLRPASIALTLQPGDQKVQDLKIAVGGA